MQKTPRPNKGLKQRAFTLIEMLVVLTIIAIMIAIAVTSFGDFGASRRQRAVLEHLQATIKSAQMDAVLTSSVLGLHIDDAAYYYQRYRSQGTTGTWGKLAHDPVGIPTNFSHDTVIHLNSPIPTVKNNPRLYFLPDGSVTPFTLTIQFNKNSFTLTSTSSGESIIEKN